MRIGWRRARTAPHVVVGFVNLYLLPDTSAKLCADVDLRVGFAEFCDGSQPSPFCNQLTDDAAFGCVDFNQPGYNPCGCVPTQKSTWGAVKSLYR
jgi:hypothetical protein